MVWTDSLNKQQREGDYVFKENALSVDDFNKLKNEVIDFLNNSKYVKYSTNMGRYYGIIKLSEESEKNILSLIRKELNDESMEIVYSQAIKYQISGEHVPYLQEHRDELNCEYTVDFAIDSTVHWPLVISGVPVGHAPNSVIMMNGANLLHKRDPYPSTSEEDYVILLFIHVSPKGDPRLEMSRKLFGIPQDKLDRLMSIADVVIDEVGNGKRLK